MWEVQHGGQSAAPSGHCLVTRGDALPAGALGTCGMLSRCVVRLRWRRRRRVILLQFKKLKQ